MLADQVVDLPRPPCLSGNALPALAMNEWNVVRRLGAIAEIEVESHVAQCVEAPLYGPRHLVAVASLREPAIPENATEPVRSGDEATILGPALASRVLIGEAERCQQNDVELGPEEIRECG